MDAASEPPAEDASELLALTRALRAEVAWLAETGATGVFSDGPHPSADDDRAALVAATTRSPERAARPSASEPAGGPGGVREPARGFVPPPTRPSGAASPAVAERSEGPSRVVAAPLARPAPLGERAASLRAESPALPRSAPGNLGEALGALGREVAGCAACALHAGRKQAVFSRGTTSSGLCFVGEAPGVEEDAAGEPFVGAAGQLLDRMIAAMGFARDEVYICNVIKCRPPENRKPEPEEIAACLPHLERQLEFVAPSVIVALGATAVEGLLGVRGGITRLRGQWRLFRGRTPVMPTFHPAYLLRMPSAKSDVWKDLQEVVRHMGRQLPAR